MTPLCRCHLDPRAECPLHPTREVPTRGQVLTVALGFLFLALAVALLWRAECFTNGALR